MNGRAKSSGWFDVENSVKFAEATYWDGDHFISRETGSRWDHQELFRTSHGNWVLHSWSAYESVRNRFRCICESEAIQWLTRNDRRATDKSEVTYAPIALHSSTKHGRAPVSTCVLKDGT